MLTLWTVSGAVARLSYCKMSSAFVPPVPHQTGGRRDILVGGATGVRGAEAEAAGDRWMPEPAPSALHGGSIHAAAQMPVSDPDAGRVKSRTHEPAKQFWEAA